MKNSDLTRFFSVDDPENKAYEFVRRDENGDIPGGGGGGSTVNSLQPNDSSNPPTYTIAKKLVSGGYVFTGSAINEGDNDITSYTDLQAYLNAKLPITLDSDGLIFTYVGSGKYYCPNYNVLGINYIAIWTYNDTTKNLNMQLIAYQTLLSGSSVHDSSNALDSYLGFYNGGLVKSGLGIRTFSSKVPMSNITVGSGLQLDYTIYLASGDALPKVGEIIFGLGSYGTQYYNVVYVVNTVDNDTNTMTLTLKAAVVINVKSLATVAGTFIAYDTSTYPSLNGYFDAQIVLAMQPDPGMPTIQLDLDYLFTQTDIVDCSFGNVTISSTDYQVLRLYKDGDAINARYYDPSTHNTNYVRIATAGANTVTISNITALTYGL